MLYVATIFTLITALLHLYFLYLEMFQWTTPLGLKAFKMNSEQAKASQTLAANQGLYNGLLAAGLILSLLLGDAEATILRSYCLSFIIIASLYGWYSVNIKIFVIQGVPAIIALAAFNLS